MGQNVPALHKSTVTSKTLTVDLKKNRPQWDKMNRPRWDRKEKKCQNQ